MKKLWKIISIIIAAALLIGLVAIAVGIFTGADINRIYSVLDGRYHVGMYIEYIVDVAAAFFPALLT